MAYTILKSNGTVLTTIADGTINTTSTSLGLPGRNYAGYGQSLDTNFVHQLENFADTTPPAYPLMGQLWYNTNTSTLCICPADGTTSASSWITLAQSGGSGTTTFGNVTVTGNLLANNITAVNAIVGDTISVRLATVTANATIATANVVLANIATLNTTVISTGSSAVAGSITGNWTLTSGSRLNATYADLAERFEADAEYDAGTVVELGGDKEITAVNLDLSEDIFGVVSATAAYLMNAGAGDDKTHPPIAMSGRVQVKVIGPVKKNDRLVSAGAGKARAAAKGEANAFNTIGRSLVEKTTTGVGMVEAIVIIK
jgi:hypothetical protein